MGRAERNHDATASQATKSGGNCLAARGGGKHHLRPPPRLQSLGDIGGGAVDIVVRAQFFRKLRPAASPGHPDDLAPHVTRTMPPEAVASTTCAPPRACRALATSVVELSI